MRASPAASCGCSTARFNPRPPPEKRVTMFKSYLKVALRRLSREKFYVSMNILSLALGIASFLVLALYLRSELTYDQHNVNYKSIYRVTAHFNQAGQEEKHFAISQIGIAPMLAQDYPQLGTYVRFVPPPVGEI